MTALTLRPSPPMSDAERAFWWADTTEWLHGQRCGSVDCQKCLDLMSATDAARAAWQVQKARLSAGAGRGR